MTELVEIHRNFRVENLTEYNGTEQSLDTLTEIEQNVIRYVAGYMCRQIRISIECTGSDNIHRNSHLIFISDATDMDTEVSSDYCR